MLHRASWDTPLLRIPRGVLPVRASASPAASASTAHAEPSCLMPGSPEASTYVAKYACRPAVYPLELAHCTSTCRRPIACCLLL